MQCISHFMTLLGNGTTVMLTTCNIIQLDSGILISLGVAKTVIVMDWCNNHCAACVQPSLLCPFSNFECAFKDGNWTSPKLWRIAIFWAIQCNTVHSDNMTPTVLQSLTMAACVMFKLTSKCSSICGIYLIMWQFGLHSSFQYPISTLISFTQCQSALLQNCFKESSPSLSSTPSKLRLIGWVSDKVSVLTSDHTQEFHQDDQHCRSRCSGWRKE